MEINVQNSFFKSLKKIAFRNRWYVKVWDTLTIDLPRFLKNIWTFRKPLWDHRWWSGHYTIFHFMQTSISDIAENVDLKGNEIRETADKKIFQMRRAVHILKTIRNDDYISLAEQEMGETLIDRDLEFADSGRGDGTYVMIDNLTPDEKAHNSRIYDRANEIEKEMFEELWMILKGQDSEVFDVKTLKSSEDPHKSWNDTFDGTGIRGWWD